MVDQLEQKMSDEKDKKRKSKKRAVAEFLKAPITVTCALIALFFSIKDEFADKPSPPIEKKDSMVLGLKDKVFLQREINIVYQVPSSCTAGSLLVEVPFSATNTGEVPIEVAEFSIGLPAVDNELSIIDDTISNSMRYSGPFARHIERKQLSDGKWSHAYYTAEDINPNMQLVFGEILRLPGTIIAPVELSDGVSFDVSVNLAVNYSARLSWNHDQIDSYDISISTVIADSTDAAIEVFVDRVDGQSEGIAYVIGANEESCPEGAEGFLFAGDIEVYEFSK